VVDAVLVAILLVGCCVAAIDVVKRVTRGCCRSGAMKREFPIADKEISHYPYRWIMVIEGVRCGECALKIERTLDRIDGVWASVDAKKGSADIRGKILVDDATLRFSVEDLGYHVCSLHRNGRDDVFPWVNS